MYSGSRPSLSRSHAEPCSPSGASSARSSGRRRSAPLHSAAPSPRTPRRSRRRLARSSARRRRRPPPRAAPPRPPSAPPPAAVAARAPRAAHSSPRGDGAAPPDGWPRAGDDGGCPCGPQAAAAPNARAALQKNLVNIKADYAERVDKWNIHLIPRYSADSALSSIADKRPIFDLP